MFVTSKTEPQKNDFTNIRILSKQAQRKLTVSTVTVTVTNFVLEYNHFNRL